MDLDKLIWKSGILLKEELELLRSFEDSERVRRIRPGLLGGIR